MAANVKERRAFVSWGAKKRKVKYLASLSMANSHHRQLLKVGQNTALFPDHSSPSSCAGLHVFRDNLRSCECIAGIPVDDVE